MKIALIGTALLVVGSLTACQNARAASTQEEAPTLVVGTFDSRAVAIAYAASDEFRAKMSAMQEELKQAREAGDTKRVNELEEAGPRLQKVFHTQAFSNAPVRDLVATIQKELPGLAEQAGVDVIVSKWSLTYQKPSARFVDVTTLVAGAFDPDEKALKHIREIVQTDPVPLSELHNH